MIRNLPTDLLRAFVTVSELNGFTQAGELLGRSQPAVSLQIKRLEALLDCTLFAREGQRLQLTQAGTRLYQYAKDILALNDAVFTDFSQSKMTGVVRFGMPSEFATTLLPKILRAYTQAYPGVTLEINCDLSKNLLAQPRKQYDLVLALQDAPSLKPASRLKEEELVWVSSPDHEVHLQAQLPLVLAPEPCVYRLRAIERLNAADRPWRLVYTNADLTGIQAAIQEGLGVTVLARNTVPDSLRVMPVSDRFPRLGKVGIHLLYDKRTSSDAILKLAEYIRLSI